MINLGGSADFTLLFGQSNMWKNRFGKLCWDSKVWVGHFHPYTSVLRFECLCFIVKSLEQMLDQGQQKWQNPSNYCSSIWEVPTPYLFDCESCYRDKAIPSFEFIYSIPSSISAVSTCGAIQFVIAELINLFCKWAWEMLEPVKMK